MSEPILLTPGDVKRLSEVKAMIDKAIAGKKRTHQLDPLLDAQRQLMEVLHWFIARDME